MGSKPIEGSIFFSDHLSLYDCFLEESPAPKISKFDEGSNENLGAVFEFVEVNETTSLWALIITEKQDYENELMQKYKFDIKIKEEKQHVVLEIINIVDNYPIVVADKSSCRFEVSSSLLNTQSRRE